MHVSSLTHLYASIGPAEPGVEQASDTHQRPAAPQAVAEEGEEEDYDPYTPLDPSEKGPLPIKPFKKGAKPRRRTHAQPGPLRSKSQVSIPVLLLTIIVT